MDDREREKLIEKLRTAKTNEERDQILRDLASQDKAALGEPGRTEATDDGKLAAGKPEGKTPSRLSQGRRSAVVAVMAIVGLFLIAVGMMKIMEGRPWGSYAGKAFAMGCGLLFAAAVDVFNRKRLAERGKGKGSVQGEAASGETAGETQEQLVPGVKVVILLMMASCGMLSIVDTVTTIMKGRVGSKEINFLIMGCAFLFAAVFVVLNEKLLATMDRAGGGRKRCSVDGEAATREHAGALQGRVAPEMRVAIIVVLAIAGLGSMVWSMLRVMSSRWDGGDMWILIQGCAFLYYAIHLLLKGKTDREKAGG